MARRKAENKKETVKKRRSASVQADHYSLAFEKIEVGGNVGGDIRIGHTIGYTAEQVSVLLKQITTTLQPKPFDGRCPYKGLEVFEEEDAELFFGRERLVNELVGRVKESRTVFITGPSGSGKSSLVRAGLIHALKHGAIKGSDRWLYETMKPGREPLKDLALAFSRLKSPDLEDYFLAHSTEVEILNKCAESVLSSRKDQRFLLFVDQFEEVFTQINSEEERIAFINMLAYAGTIEDGRVIVLFAMRSDFVSNCATYPALNELLSQEFRQIGAMQPEELVSAIALPARHVGLPVEHQLIAQIINDMRGEPDALPLMQFALKDLFDAKQAEGGIIALTLADYLKHGGIHKSLERHADATFAKLSEREQELTRSIFSGLIEIGRGTQDTKRTALFDELIPASAKAEDISNIVQKLADARLIITDEQAGKDTVTISHEKLIEAWPWLRKLVNENRGTIALQNEVASDAKEWEDHNRDESYLYSGARLANAREQVEGNKLVLSGLAQEFIEAGVKAHTEELEAARQRTVQLRNRSVYLSVALVVALIAVGVAVLFGVQSRKQANIALARQLAAQAQSFYSQNNSKQMLAVLLAIRSMELLPSVETSEILQNYNTLTASISHMTVGDTVNSVAFSPDGKYVVLGSDDKTLRVWEVSTRKEIARMNKEFTVESVAFSPDSTYVVSGGISGICVWEVLSEKEISCMDEPGGVLIVSFSPDGKYVVSGSLDGSVSVWETITGKEIAHMMHDDPESASVDSVAFSPNGKYVVSGSWDKTVRVWEAITGEEVTHMRHDGEVTTVAFSQDGRFVVSGSFDNTARVWEATTGKEIARMTHENIVHSVAFSPDVQYVVSGGGDNARVWEVTTGKELARTTHDDTVTTVAFSWDGKSIISGSADSSARVWETMTGNEIIEIMHEKQVNSVAFSPDGRYVISGSDDNTVRVWDSESIDVRSADLDYSKNKYYADHQCGKFDATNSTCIRFVTLVKEHTTGGDIEIARIITNELLSIYQLSWDGKYYVVLDGKTASVRETSTSKEVVRMSHDNTFTDVAFSPDGKYIVSSSWDDTARVWEIATGTEIARLDHISSVMSVAFSPDSKYVVTGGGDKTARVWEAATGIEVNHVTHDNTVNSVAFSPDGMFVVSGGFDNTARVWEAATGIEITRIKYEDDIVAVTFSTDGVYVIINLSDIRFWRPENLVDEACSRVNRNLTRAEWKQYIGNVSPYHAICPNLPIEPAVTSTSSPTP